MWSNFASNEISYFARFKESNKIRHQIKNFVARQYQLQTINMHCILCSISCTAYHAVSAPEYKYALHIMQRPDALKNCCIHSLFPERIHCTAPHSLPIHRQQAGVGVLPSKSALLIIWVSGSSGDGGRWGVVVLPSKSALLTIKAPSDSSFPGGLHAGPPLASLRPRESPLFWGCPARTETL